MFVVSLRLGRTRQPSLRVLVSSLCTCTDRRKVALSALDMTELVHVLLTIFEMPLPDEYAAA